MQHPFLRCHYGRFPSSSWWGARRTYGDEAALIAACAALALRAIGFAAFDSAPILVTAQVLDEIGAGILDVLIPLMLADIVGGTGRFSLSRALLGTIQGVGGSQIPMSRYDAAENTASPCPGSRPARRRTD